MDRTSASVIEILRDADPFAEMTEPRGGARLSHCPRPRGYKGWAREQRPAEQPGVRSTVRWIECRSPEAIRSVRYGTYFIGYFHADKRSRCGPQLATFTADKNTCRSSTVRAAIRGDGRRPLLPLGDCRRPAPLEICPSDSPAMGAKEPCAMSLPALRRRLGRGASSTSLTL
jgi:hypothetical protein